MCVLWKKALKSGDEMHRVFPCFKKLYLKEGNLMHFSLQFCSMKYTHTHNNKECEKGDKWWNGVLAVTQCVNIICGSIALSFHEFMNSWNIEEIILKKCVCFVHFLTPKKEAKAWRIKNNKKKSITINIVWRWLGIYGKINHIPIPTFTVSLTRSLLHLTHSLTHTPSLSLSFLTNLNSPRLCINQLCSYISTSISQSNASTT